MLEIKLLSFGHYIKDHDTKKLYLTETGSKEQAEELKNLIKQTKQELTLMQKVQIRQQIKKIINKRHDLNMLFKSLNLNPASN